MTMHHGHDPKLESRSRPPRQPQRSFGPLTPLVELFSRVWLGITLLALLLLYGWVGSAGFWIPGHYGLGERHAWIHDIYWIIPWSQLHFRQSPWLEQTEFEWFHWWPFTLMIALLCLNVATTTVRRIPFKPINFGVWTIHTGVILLALSCTWYFWSKIEGDVLLPMRTIVITLENGERGTLTAHPGNSITLNHSDEDEAITISVHQIDPNWEILSGQHAGMRAYSATVRIEGPQATFLRQIIAGFPQYTEDIVPSGEPGQPFVRLRNLTGERILDNTLNVAFQPAVRDTMHLREHASLYVREHGERDWYERPLKKLPRYHDHVSDISGIWPTAERTVRFGELQRPVEPVGGHDPLPGITVHVTDVLQYAFDDMNFSNTAAELNPVARVRLEAPGQRADYDLLAFDPLRASAESGRLAFRWLQQEQQLQQMLRPARLHLSIEDDELQFQQTIDVADLPRDRFVPIGTSGYSMQFERVENDLTLDRDTRFSVAMVLIETPDGRRFRRWVFDDPARNRDMETNQFGPSEQGEALFDQRLVVQYEPGGAPGTVTVLAGPDEAQLRVLLALPGRALEVLDLRRHTAVSLDRGVTITLLDYAPRALFESRPIIVPRAQRDRNIGQQFSMIGVRIEEAMEDKVYWVPFHLYPLQGSHERLRRFPYQPAVIPLKDGRLIELMYSRRSHPLGFAVALEEFQLIEHVGGFTGASLSVRDWRSIVRFAQAAPAQRATSPGDDEHATEWPAHWSQAAMVAMNKPATNDGLSFFQAQWDPPEMPQYPGLNYTVLGVGNRQGVNAMLASSSIIVIGLLYAFYIKPLIRRRRQLAALAAHQAKAHTAPAGDDAGESAAAAAAQAHASNGDLQRAASKPSHQPNQSSSDDDHEHDRANEHAKQPSSKPAPLSFTREAQP